MRHILLSAAVATSFLASSCAWLHHVQVGDVDSDPNFSLRPFELKVSETGVNFEEAGKIAKALNTSKVGQRDIGNFSAILQLFQMGPRTGNPTFNESFAKNIVNDLYKECPSGRITGVVSIREARKYPVISGEIVKIKGYCMLPKKSGNTSMDKSSTYPILAAEPIAESVELKRASSKLSLETL